jgi:hypothetical protein
MADSVGALLVADLSDASANSDGADGGSHQPKTAFALGLQAGAPSSQRFQEAANEWLPCTVEERYPGSESDNATAPENEREENAPGVGGWGGTCTCPDGSVYQVGDENNNCGSIACFGGVAGSCRRNNPGGNGVKVTCAPPPDLFCKYSADVGWARHPINTENAIVRVGDETLNQWFYKVDTAGDRAFAPDPSELVDQGISALDASKFMRRTTKYVEPIPAVALVLEACTADAEGIDCDSFVAGKPKTCGAGCTYTEPVAAQPAVLPAKGVSYPDSWTLSYNFLPLLEKEWTLCALYGSECAVEQLSVVRYCLDLKGNSICEYKITNTTTGCSGADFGLDVNSDENPANRIKNHPGFSLVTIDSDGNHVWAVSKNVKCERIAVGFAPKLEALPGVFGDQVELYVRPVTKTNPKCVDCAACFDSDGRKMHRNLALSMPTSQSSTQAGESMFAVDGDATNTGWTEGEHSMYTCSYTDVSAVTATHWWMVDLGDVVAISGARIYAAVNSALDDGPSVANIGLTRFRGSPTSPFIESETTMCNTQGVKLYPGSSTEVLCPGSSGRYVYVIAEGTQLGLCEVEVYGVTPACPDFCVANPKRVRAINAAHQLAMTSNDIQPSNCAYANDSTYENSNTSAPVCDGVITTIAGEFSAKSPFRLGGSFYHGFFVAPIDAEYTFRAQFNDAGQIWLSRDENPENKELVIDGTAESVPSGWFGPRWDKFQAHFNVAISTSGSGLPGALFATLLGSKATSEEILLVRGGAPGSVQTHVKTMQYWDTEGHLLSGGIIRGLRLRSPAALACVDEIVVTVAGRGYSFQPPACFGGDAEAPALGPAETIWACENTASWSNGHGYDCAAYVTQGWCDAGTRSATAGNQWTLGDAHNYPESNCCACGKEMVETTSEAPAPALAPAPPIHVDVAKSWPVQDLSVSDSRGSANASLTQNYGPISMHAGEVRFFGAVHTNSFGDDLSLLTLEINSTDGHRFVTSDVDALSAEFFRVPASTPQIEVAVNDLVASCKISGPADGDGCRFEFSADRTPVISSVERVVNDTLQISGSNFGNISSVLSVSIGRDGVCHVTNCSDSAITCEIDASVGAGRHAVSLYLHPWGYATAGENDTLVDVYMTIDSITPESGSLYGGSIVAISGKHMHNFGPFNQVLLKSDNVTVPCIPRTLRNHECRISDSIGSSSGWGVDCLTRVGKLYTAEEVRRRSEWFDYSNSSRLECVVGDTVELLPHTVDVIVKPVESTLTLADIDSQFDYAFENMCEELLSRYCYGFGQRGGVADYFAYSDEFEAVLPQAFSFTTESTPTVTHVTPSEVLPGAVVHLGGFGFVPAMQPVNAGWVLTGAGTWEEVNTVLKVSVGEFPCALDEFNNSYIRCEAPVNAAYNDPNAELYTYIVSVWVYGRGRSSQDVHLSYDLYIDAVDVLPSAQTARAVAALQDLHGAAPRGSLAGGTRLGFGGGGFSDTELLNGNFPVYTYLCSHETPCNMVDPEFGVNGEFEGGTHCTVESVNSEGLQCTTGPQPFYETEVYQADGDESDDATPTHTVDYTAVAPCRTHNGDAVVAFDENSCENTGNIWATPCTAMVCSGNDDGTAPSATCVAPLCWIPNACNETETSVIDAVGALAPPSLCTAPNCTDPVACTESEVEMITAVSALLHPSETQCSAAGGVHQAVRHSRSYATLCASIGGIYSFQPVPCRLNTDGSACNITGGDCKYETWPLDATDIFSCNARIPELNNTAGQVIGHNNETGIYSMLYTIPKTYCDAPKCVNSFECTAEELDTQRVVAEAIEGVDNPTEAMCVQSGGLYVGHSTTKIAVENENSDGLAMYTVGKLYTITEEVQGADDPEKMDSVETSPIEPVTGIAYRLQPLSSTLTFCPQCGRVVMTVCTNTAEDDRIDSDIDLSVDATCADKELCAAVTLGEPTSADNCAAVSSFGFACLYTAADADNGVEESCAVDVDSGATATCETASDATEADAVTCADADCTFTAYAPVPAGGTSLWSVPIACNMPQTFAEVRTKWQTPCTSPAGASVFNASSVKLYQCQQPDFLKSSPAEYKSATILPEFAELVHAGLVARTTNGSICVAPPCADPSYCSEEETAVIAAVASLVSAEPVDNGIRIYGDYETVDSGFVSAASAHAGEFYSNGVDRLPTGFWYRAFDEDECTALGGLYEVSKFNATTNTTYFDEPRLEYFNEKACQLSTTTILQPRELCMALPCSLSEECEEAKGYDDVVGCPIHDEAEDKWICTEDECLCGEAAANVTVVLDTMVSRPGNVTDHSAMCIEAGGIFNRTCVASVCAELTCGIHDVACMRKNCTTNETSVAIRVGALAQDASETQCLDAKGSYHPLLSKLTYNHTWEQVRTIDQMECESTNNTWTEARVTSEFLAYMKASVNKVLYPADCRVNRTNADQLYFQTPIMNTLDGSNRILPGHALSPNATWNSTSQQPGGVSPCSFTHDVELTPRITIYTGGGPVAVGSVIELVLEDYPIDMYAQSQVEDFSVTSSSGLQVCSHKELSTAQQKCYGGAQFSGDPRTMQGLHGRETGCTPTNFTPPVQHHCGPYLLGMTPCHQGSESNTARRSLFCKVAPMAAAAFAVSVSVAPFGNALVSGGTVEVVPVVDSIDAGLDDPRVGSKAGGSELLISGRGLIDWQSQLMINVAGAAVVTSRILTRDPPNKVCYCLSVDPAIARCTV